MIDRHIALRDVPVVFYMLHLHGFVIRQPVHTILIKLYQIQDMVIGSLVQAVMRICKPIMRLIKGGFWGIGLHKAGNLI